ADRGFHGVSVHDIGAACGISGPALYRHFTGKDAILSAALVDISNRLYDEGCARKAAAAGPAQALESLIAWHIEFAVSHPSLILLQEREWRNLDTASRNEVRRLQLAYIDVWVDVVRSLRPERDRPTARAA